MVDSAIWHESSDILVATSDAKLMVWYYPDVVYVDTDMLPITREVRDARCGSPVAACCA
jgi:intraflagellar transport protein 80